MIELFGLFDSLATFQPPAPVPPPGAVAGTPTICGALQEQLLAPLTGCTLWSCWVPFTSLFCFATCFCSCLWCLSIYSVPAFLTNIPYTVTCIIGFVSMPIKVCCGMGSAVETMVYQNVLPSEMSTWFTPLLYVCCGGGTTVILPA